jgi:hypothetical protein
MYGDEPVFGTGCSAMFRWNGPGGIAIDARATRHSGYAVGHGLKGERHLFLNVPESLHGDFPGAAHHSSRV